ncbi:hypothetical protein C8039_07120 [Halogeometricum sp. wsp3]|nr:hypothetical protein C8039_07120 [Halogeometricum sp. wsp3]
MPRPFGQSPIDRQVTEKVVRLCEQPVLTARTGTDRALAFPYERSFPTDVTQANPDAEISIQGPLDTTVLAPSNELRIGLLELVENAIAHSDNVCRGRCGTQRVRTQRIHRTR